MDAYDRLQQELRAHPHARLVAVSKTKPVEQILALYQRGQRIFGENKPQEMAQKQALLPTDIDWHLIGHLQTNKVKLIAPFVGLIHSVDSLRLLMEIDKQAQRFERTIPCLLQIKIAQEESKFGLAPEAAMALVADPQRAKLVNAPLVGVMGLATFTEDTTQIKEEFALLQQVFQQLKTTFFAADPSFRECSMGMSDDYPLALEAGSTMIRIGTLLFGQR